MDIDFEGAISRARELDQYLAQNGKLAGPLHGLPVSLKVYSHMLYWYGQQDLTYSGSGFCERSETYFWLCIMG